MKKLLLFLMAAIYMFSGLLGCSPASAGDPANKNGVSASSAEPGTEGSTLKIVTTIFPEYDWVKTILGDKAGNADITLLLDNGVDLHSYQPTAEDILKISTCDLFIYVGGESDDWVDDALKEAVNENMVVINLLETLGDEVKAEELVEGMEHDHDHEHEEGEAEEHEHEEGEAEEHGHEEGEAEEHEHEEGEEHEHEEGEEHDHEHELELDEHVWLSLRYAQVICGSITEALKKIDSANGEVYEKNLEAYVEQLAALDREYTEAVEASEVKTLLFGDRFPFRYLTDDYGLDYYAAFAGCSAETEASFETIVFLANKVDELGLSSIMTIEGKDHRIAETIRDNTGTKDQKILTLDSLQSASSSDAESGTDYLSVMKSNLEVLKEALK